MVDSGQLSLFASGYWGHPAYTLPPEVDLLAVAHYLEALSWQKDFIRMHAVLWAARIRTRNRSSWVVCQPPWIRTSRPP